MVDAQNERTPSRNQRRRRRRRRGRKPADVMTEQQAQPPKSESEPEISPTAEPDIPAPEPTAAPDAPVVRPADIAPPDVRSEEYCIHHMANTGEIEPMEVRTNMTTLRHLQVDHFGEATLFCDCLHNGPHEWPPSMQRLPTAIELDQFLADSTNEA